MHNFHTFYCYFSCNKKKSFHIVFPGSWEGSVFDISQVCRDTDCITTHRRACSRLYAHACASPRRGIFSGGAKAPTTELEAVRLQSVVRRLRTTDGKRTPSNSTVCAFAPPKKLHRPEVRWEMSKTDPSAKRTAKQVR